MKIIAHRGGAGLGPENTLSCIEKGLGCKHTSMIEIDVHLTKDGQVVVMHDPDVDRMTDGTGKIENMTLAELKTLHIVDKNGIATEDRIPTLAEVLDAIGDRAEVLLEIKRPDDRDDGLEKACLDIIKAAGAYGRVTVQSFNDIVLDRFHNMDPEIRLEKLLFVRPFNLQKVAQQKHIRSYNIYRRSLVTPRFVSRMHALGKEVKVWTLQSPEQYHAHNLDGIITDRPDLISDIS
jgi:glycerophosphoryl diester phosphodiesterase